VVESDISLYPHIQTHAHKWGFKQKVPRKVHVNTASREEKERFKKEQERYWIIISSSRRDSR
jgi:putative transposase